MINNRIGNERPRILVVDDEKDILRIIKRDLESTFVDENNTSEDKFDVETFSNGQDALKAIESHPNNYYDLVLTDIRMPKMNGFELYRRIKEKNSTLKIAFITAFEINQEEFSKVLPSIDVQDFIIKPIGMSNLRTKLKSMIQK
ncbi:MAG: response regulator [Nitrososphaeraceae archaeon]|jgi:CheY-like chemotaxis protein